MYRYVSDISTDHILIINEREVVLDLILPANPEQLLSEEIRLFGYYSDDGEDFSIVLPRDAYVRCK